MNERERAESQTILRVPAGSELVGLNVPGIAEGSDHDEVGVCVEDLEQVAGFDPFEQYVFRTATERTGKTDEPSIPGDLDLTIYSFRKFMKLAMHGNPQIVQCLFVPENLCVVRNPIGAQLQEIAPYIISRQAGRRYLGFMESQRQKLMGERGQKRVNRPELVDKFGYDTKYAMHILRLGYQGIQLLEEGQITFPLRERDYVYSIRQGGRSLNEVLNKAGQLERELKLLVENGPLRELADLEFVEDWMCHIYFETWKARRFNPLSFKATTHDKHGMPL